MYKYILLDWDGCLAKTLDIWLNAYIESFSAEGLHPSEEEIVKQAFGQREKGMKNLKSGNPDRSWQRVVENVDTEIKNVKLYDGAQDLLKSLRKMSKKTALLTSSDRKTIAPAFDKYKINDFFDAVLTKDDVVNRKPDPEIFLKSLKQLGGNKDEAIVVGDSYHDVLGGKNAGIKTVAFYPKENEKFYSKEELLSQTPDFLITDLKALLEIVK